MKASMKRATQNIAKHKAFRKLDAWAVLNWADNSWESVPSWSFRTFSSTWAATSGSPWDIFDDRTDKKKSKEVMSQAGIWYLPWPEMEQQLNPSSWIHGNHRRPQRKAFQPLVPLSGHLWLIFCDYPRLSQVRPVRVPEGILQSLSLSIEYDWKLFDGDASTIPFIVMIWSRETTVGTKNQ